MIEKILGTGFFLSILIRDIFGFHEFDYGTIIFGPLLAILYLVANWWTNRPPETTFRTIALTGLYGLTFSCFTFTVIFKLLYLIGSAEMTILSFILMVITLLLDFIPSINKTMVLNAKTTIRLCVFAPFVGIFFFISDDARVKFTYRDDEKFINYYETNKEQYQSIFDLREAYIKK